LDKQYVPGLQQFVPQITSPLAQGLPHLAFGLKVPGHAAPFGQTHDMRSIGARWPLDPTQQISVAGL